MQYQFYDLKNVSAGKIVEVQLGYAANVRVMDRTNYLKFKVGKRYKFMGDMLNNLLLK